MKLNSGESFTYFVNEEKRTVVAILTVPQGIMGTEMLRIIQKESGSYFGMDDCVLGRRMVLKGRYEGKAVCHSDDEWDIEKGKHLAKLRALRAYLKDRKEISKVLVSVYEGVAERMRNADDYSNYVMEHITDAIDKYDD